MSKEFLACYALKEKDVFFLVESAEFLGMD